MRFSVNMENSGLDLESIQKKRKSRWYYPSHGDELDLELEGDKVIKTLPEENSRRRTIILYKLNNSWGFTIQSYGIHHKKEKEIEMLTYVDYIAPGGAGHLGGMRPGDVILSINGKSMEDVSHKDLVQFIQSAGDTMRVVVLFEDCCRKVELHMRYLKLQRILVEKIFELRSLESQEKRVLKGLPRFDSRMSYRSSSSSSLNSALDDRLSLRPELDRCPSPLAIGPGSRSPSGSPRGSAVRLTPRHEYERASMPAGLKSLATEDTGSSASLTDASGKGKRKHKKAKRLFSLGLENYLPVPRFPLSPHGGAKSKVLMQKLSSAPASVYGSTRATSAKKGLDVEMNTFKVKLGDGNDIGSSSTDDFLDTTALWQPEASPGPPRSSTKSPSDPSGNYQRMENEDDSWVGGSLQSLDSAQSSIDFSLGSPDSTLDDESIGDASLKPNVGRGDSHDFYQTFIEDQGIPSLSPTILPSSSQSGVRNPNPGKRPNSGQEILSSPESSASLFSYSDVPAITVSFVNDTDEITYL